MRLRKLAITILFIVTANAAAVFSQTNPQRPGIDPFIVVNVGEGKVTVSGKVDKESSRQAAIDVVRTILPEHSITSAIEADQNVKPLDDRWQNEFEKTVGPVRTWKSGMVRFAWDDETRKRVFSSFLTGATITRLRDAGQVPLVDPNAKATIIFLYATWCGPCRKPFPDLIDLYDKYSADGLQIVALNTDQESSEQLEEFFNTTGVKFSGGWTSEADENRFTGYSRFQGIPQAFLFSQGRLVHLSLGGSPESIKKLVESTKQIFDKP
jgi:thiol-disulfide isomerase/thioredoxin